MEQQNNLTNQPIQQKSKTPIGVIIVAVLMLLNGVGALVLGLMSFMLIPLLSIPLILLAVILIATAVGIRKMKRWGLYLFTIATMLAIGLNLYATSFKNLSLLLNNAIQVLILVYFWSMHKRFR